MKWPLSVTIVRHVQSTYNALRAKKAADPEYQDFVREFNRDSTSELARKLAFIIKERYALGVSDYDTPISAEGRRQSNMIGMRILEVAPQPDAIFIGPYCRTEQTFEGMVSGPSGFKPGNAKIIHGEDRIREQEHGLSLLYNDWRVFHVLHPEQKALYDLMGPYWYQYPQGESVSMVRDRIRLFTNMLVREYYGQHVWLISHHLTKLCIRANFERLTPEQFIHLDRHEKPVNGGVTLYRGNPGTGVDGRLELVEYNRCLHHVH